MKTITRGGRSRVRFVLVDEKKKFSTEKAWMNDFAGWLA